MKKKKVEKVEERPGKILISCPTIECWTDELLKTDFGFQWMMLDVETKEPVLLSLTVGGVLIAEYNTGLSQEQFSEMVREQNRMNNEMLSIAMSKMDELKKTKVAAEMAGKKEPTSPIDPNYR